MSLSADPEQSGSAAARNPGDRLKPVTGRYAGGRRPASAERQGRARREPAARSTAAHVPGRRRGAAVPHVSAPARLRSSRIAALPTRAGLCRGHRRQHDEQPYDEGEAVLLAKAGTSR